MRDFENPMRYPVTLTPAVEGGFVVSFPDIPEALTQGNTRHDALQAAQAALITAFEFYFDDNEAIPLPSAVSAEDDYVEIPLSVASKVLLLNAFLESKITQQELAARIGISQTHLCNLEHDHARISMKLLLRIASTLGCALEVLLDTKAAVAWGENRDEPEMEAVEEEEASYSLEEVRLLLQILQPRKSSPRYTAVYHRRI